MSAGNLGEAGGVRRLSSLASRASASRNEPFQPISVAAGFDAELDQPLGITDVLTIRKPCGEFFEITDRRALLQTHPSGMFDRPVVDRDECGRGLRNGLGRGGGRY